MRRTALIVSSLAMLASAGCFGGLADRFNPLGPNPVTQQIDTMKSTACVPYVIAFHPKPAVGQFAVTKDAGGESWMGIVDGKAGAWIVEKRAVVPGSDKQMTTVMQVDDQGLVAKAWAAPYAADAKEKPKAEAVKVMEKPAPAAAGAASGPEPKWSKETVDGKALDRCDMGETTCWYSAEALFAHMLDGAPVPQGGIVKTAYQGTVVSEITKQGSDTLALSCVLP
jgi:hypothetical protein